MPAASTTGDRGRQPGWRLPAGAPQPSGQGSTHPLPWLPRAPSGYRVEPAARIGKPFPALGGRLVSLTALGAATPPGPTGGDVHLRPGGQLHRVPRPGRRRRSPGWPARWRGAGTSGSSEPQPQPAVRGRRPVRAAPRPRPGPAGGRSRGGSGSSSTAPAAATSWCSPAPCRRTDRGPEATGALDPVRRQACWSTTRTGAPWSRCSPATCRRAAATTRLPGRTPRPRPGCGGERTTLVKRIEYLRTRLTNGRGAEHAGLERDEALAEYALTTGLITRDDLHLLDPS